MKYALLFLLLIPVVIAANDPGHDTLYIEQEGDSELNGSFNVTNNVIITGNNTVSGLELYGDGTDPSTGTYISAGTGPDILRIDTPGDLYLKDGGGDTLYVGASGLDTYIFVYGGINSTQHVNASVDICITGGVCLSAAGSGDGNLTGSGASTDNAITRWNGAGGSSVQNSGVTIDDSNNVVVPGYINATGYINSTVDVCVIGGNCLSALSSGDPDQNLWETISSDSGSTTASTTTDTLTIAGSGIASTAVSGDTLTVTATEADTLDAVADRGASTDQEIQAGNFLTTGATTFRTYVGEQAGDSSTSNYTTVIGQQAGISNTGTHLTATGVYAGAENTGTYLAAYGVSSGRYNQGDLTTAFGSYSGYNNSGNGVTGVGYQAGWQNTGHNLVAFGVQAGMDNIGNSSVFIGYRAGRNNAINNQLIIHHNISDTDTDPLIQGDFANENITFDADVNVTTGKDICITGGNCLSTAGADEATVEGYIFDTDAEDITGVWEVQDDVNFAFGSSGEWTINYDNSVDDQLLIQTTKTGTITTSDPLLQILVGTTPTADQQVFGIAKGTQATNTDIMYIDEDGDTYLLGDLDIVGGDITTGTLRFGTTATGGNFEFEDGGVCVGSGGCTASSTDGTLYVEYGMVIDADGSVGTPQSGFLIIGDGTDGAHGIEIEDGTMCIGDGGCTAPATDGYLLVEGQIVAGTGSATNATGVGDIFASSDIEADGNAYIDNNIYYGGNLTGYGADLAENVHADDTLEPGDVVIISNTRAASVKKTTVPYDTRVAGIISTDPSHLMSADEGDIPLALAGRVPVKASNENGIIMPGDLLTTSSIPGHVMRCESQYACTGSIVGKAMSEYENGMITALVMLG